MCDQLHKQASHNMYQGGVLRVRHPAWAQVLCDVAQRPSQDVELS